MKQKLRFSQNNENVIEIIQNSSLKIVFKLGNVFPQKKQTANEVITETKFCRADQDHVFCERM